MVEEPQHRLLLFSLGYIYLLSDRKRSYVFFPLPPCLPGPASGLSGVDLGSTSRERAHEASTRIETSLLVLIQVCSFFLLSLRWGHWV